MRIVRLEQGDWVRPNHDPSNRRDRESHRYGDFATIPIRRGLPAHYPINDDGSPIKIVNVNGVGGSTVMCMGHFPRLHPSDFKVRALDGVADDWPIGYDTLEPFYAENGIANSSGLVGKNLMLHPNGHACGCVDDPMDNRGPPLCLTSQEFYETDPSRDFVRGYTLQFGLGLPSILETIVLTANGRLPARGFSDLAHVFVVQVNQIAKRANVPHRAWLGRSIAVDVALHFERPFFAVLAPSERLGHITGLAADLDAPVSGCQLCEGRHACALRPSCALCVHREVKTGTNVCNFV